MQSNGNGTEVWEKGIQVDLPDGEYEIEVQLTGGSGRASVTSPAILQVQDEKAVIEIEWSSPNYDYMTLDGETYLPVNTEGNSVFELPVTAFDKEVPVTADTTAMSVPHEIEYTILLDSASIANAGKKPMEVIAVVYVAAVIAVSITAWQIHRKKRKKRMKQIKKIGLWCMLLFACIQMAGCGDSQTSWKSEDHEISSELTYEKSMDLDYATEFTVDYYENGFTLISISDGSRFLLNTEEEKVPEDLEEGITVLNAPVSNIYLVASATMDMFCSIDALDHICLSGLTEEKWEIPGAKAAMESGQILYAGKYNAPDYELICSKDCELAIESTMIGHSPEVKENLESFGIPVLVDHSSYESDPLGRTEWVKLYGVLTGKEDAAVKAFEEQKQYVKEFSDVKATGKTVAFFYVTTAGTVSVRKSNDYVPKMIDIAGGEYVFQNLKGEDNAVSSVNMQMEEFYAQAKDADYLVYNSTIDGNLTTVDDLLAKNSLFADFKAVKDGNVWCIGKNLYQDTMDTGSIIHDFHEMLTSEDTDELTYMYKLK
jgi:iron complex transport system substrate-binding protein